MASATLKSANKVEPFLMMGNKIAERRKKLQWDRRGGFTQKDVADKLGISREGYCHYEKGRNEVSLSALPRLAEILEVPVTYFFENVEQIDPDLLRLVHRFKGLEGDELNQLGEMADFFREKRRRKSNLKETTDKEANGRHPE